MPPVFWRDYALRLEGSGGAKALTSDFLASFLVDALLPEDERKLLENDPLAQSKVTVPYKLTYG